MALTKTPVCDFGKKAEDFKLKSINNKLVSLNDIKGDKATLIMFICNHCPYVKAIIKDLAKDCNELKKDGINSVAIMSNDTKNYPEDSFENMIKFADMNNFDELNYLYDETQEVAHSYGAKRTPEFFLFNSENVLVYRGRMDDSPRDPTQATTSELKDAIDAMLEERTPSVSETESIGCSVKWKA